MNCHHDVDALTTREIINRDEQKKKHVEGLRDGITLVVLELEQGPLDTLSNREHSIFITCQNKWRNYSRWGLNELRSMPSEELTRLRGDVEAISRKFLEMMARDVTCARFWFMEEKAYRKYSDN